MLARPALPTHTRRTPGLLAASASNSSRYGAALRPRTSPDGLAALNEDRSSTRSRLPPTSQQAGTARDSLITTHSLGTYTVGATRSVFLFERTLRPSGPELAFPSWALLSEVGCPAEVGGWGARISLIPLLLLLLTKGAAMDMYMTVRRL